MACGTLAGLALGLGGTAANEVANSNIRNQSNAAVANALAQQQQFQQKASNVFNQSFNNSTPQAAQQQVQSGQNQLGGLIGNIAQTPLSLSSPTFGLTNADAQQARQSNSNQAAANLGGYSNYPLQQYLSNLNANSNLGLISNQAQGAYSTLGPLLSQAQQSQQGLQALGSLLGTSGNLTGLMGGVNNGLGNGYTGSQLNMLGGLGSQGIYPYSTTLPATNSFNAFSNFS